MQEKGLAGVLCPPNQPALPNRRCLWWSCSVLGRHVRQYECNLLPWLARD
jgi:hypothetical protein